MGTADLDGRLPATPSEAMPDSTGWKGLSVLAARMISSQTNLDETMVWVGAVDPRGEERRKGM